MYSSRHRFSFLIYVLPLRAQGGRNQNDRQDDRNKKDWAISSLIESGNKGKKNKMKRSELARIESKNCGDKRLSLSLACKKLIALGKA